MIHPSYAEMVDAMNRDGKFDPAGEEMSRFSIVQATAKRARQLVSGADPMIDVHFSEGEIPKALSIAVEEFYQDRVHIETDPAADRTE